MMLRARLHRATSGQPQVPLRSCSRFDRAELARQRSRCVCQGLPFGFGRPKEVIDDEKERMWEAQQEILRARREGRSMEGVAERRMAAKAAEMEKEAKKERIRQQLARGERPEDADEKYEPYGEEDEGMKGGFLIPLAPFGIPKYDNGERFDLKAPYTDVGWEDPDADPFKWAKNLFGGKKEEDSKAAPSEGSNDAVDETSKDGKPQSGKAENQ